MAVRELLCVSQQGTGRNFAGAWRESAADGGQMQTHTKQLTICSTTISRGSISRSLVRCLSSAEGRGGSVARTWRHSERKAQSPLIVAKLIDYLGGEPAVTPKPVKTSEKAREMLRFDLDNENDTIQELSRARQAVRVPG